jgi:hypothetical protein
LNRGTDETNDSPLRILCITQGQWGERIAVNIQQTAPADWSVEIRGFPRVLPPVIDDPEDFVPPDLPESDLLLALGEISGLAQLVPDIAKATGVRSVLAPIDRNESLPPGLVGQLQAWLDQLGVAAVFPKPFCSLTEETINYGRLRTSYDDPLVRRFASSFGKPELMVQVDHGRVTQVEVLRDAACGCARDVAEHLEGIPVDQSLEEAGMLHHHFPCLASMNQDADYHDTLMHVSGNILKDSLKEALGEHLKVAYARPAGQVAPTPSEVDKEVPTNGEAPA